MPPAHAASTPGRASASTRIALAALFIAFTVTVLPGPAAAVARASNDAAIVSRLTEHGDRIERASVRVLAEPGSLPAETLSRFADHAETAANGIRHYLGEHVQLRGDDTDRVTFFISRGVGISHASRRHPHLFIESWRIARERAPYVHEAVHAMAAWSSRATWISEGLAEHVAAAVVDRDGGYHTVVVEPRGLAALPEHLASAHGRAVLPLVGAVGTRAAIRAEHRELFDRIRSERRTYAAAFYVFSWSFVDHIVARAGLDGLRAIAEADGADVPVRRATGKTLAEWKAEWLATLEPPQPAG